MAGSVLLLVIGMMLILAIGVLPTNELILIAAVPWVLYLWQAHPVTAIVSVMGGIFVLTGTTENVSPTEIGVLGFAVVLIVDAIVGNPILTKPTWAQYYLKFIAFALVSTGISVAFGSVLVMDALRELVVFIYYLLLFPTIHYLRTPASRHFLAGVLYFVLALTAVRDFNVIILQNVTPGLAQALASAFSVVIPSPGTPVAWYLLALFPIIVHRRLIPLILQPVMFLLSFVGLANIIVGGSRSYWLGLLVAGLVLVFVSVKEEKKSPVLLRFILGVGALVVLGWSVLLFIQSVDTPLGIELSQRFSTLQDLSDDYSVQGRLNEAENAMAQFAQSPIFGQGIGYQVTSNIHVWLADGGEVTRGFLHSALIYLLTKTGIIGTVLYFSFYVSMTQRVYRVSQRRDFDDHFIIDLSRLAFVLLVALGITSLVNSHLQFIHSVIGLILLVGVVLSCDRVAIPQGNGTYVETTL